MFSVALIGPDGAGKTTIGRQVQRTLPLPVKYVYMGINIGSSNILLPTSRVIVAIRRALENKNGAAQHERTEANHSKPKLFKRLTKWLRSYVRLANLLAEESFRHWLVWYYEARGNVVLLDRWFFADYCASNATGKQPLSRRIHGYLMEHFYPQPDLVIYLEAPADVLFSRKGESSLDVLELRRQKYLQLRDKVKNFCVVDASQSTNKVAQEVSALIHAFHRKKFDCRSKQILCETGGQ